MTSRAEYKLKEWGSWVERNIDWADLLGENILHRAGILSGRVQEGTYGHKVLCPDSPPSVRKTNRAVQRLSAVERDALILWYCLPVRHEDGKPHTKQELAGFLRVSKETFKKRLYRARRNFRKMLDHCIKTQ